MRKDENICILTPVKDAEEHLEAYYKNLSRLSYPHQKISLGLLESDSRDNTYSILKQKLPELKKKFRKAGLWKKDFGFHIPEGMPQWAGTVQLERRTSLARSRNHLLFRALEDEDWVLWLDVDVVEYPADIIQSLLRTGKEIVQPNCVTKHGGKSYDLNAWRDRGRKHLHDMREEGDLVELHSVGGTMLFIKADIHRDGLIFPPFLYGRASKRVRRTQFFFANKKEVITDIFRIPRKLFSGKYRGEIETEGLGIMAHDMGYTCWGMPNLEIRHL